MKTILATTVAALALTAMAGSAFAHDQRNYRGNNYNERQAQNQRMNPHHITGASQNTNLSGDTARGSGTAGMSNHGRNPANHAKTYHGEQTSASVIKH